MSRNRSSARIGRREVLARAALGAAGLTFVGRAARRVFAEPREAARRGAPAPRATSVIELWMSGGPSHLDTFDPKAEAGSDFCGPLAKPISTNADGVRISELLPLLAQQADKYSIVRTMSHGIDAHETATYAMQSGRRSSENGLVYPAFGAVVSSFKGYGHGYEGRIPPYVVLTQPLGRFAVEGFLGLDHKPFVTGGDPRQERFAVEGIVAEGVSDARQAARRRLLHTLDTLGRALPGDPSFEKLDRAEASAYEMILGDAGRVFDLQQETAAVRDRYGRTTFGQSCLAARRLVEKGVPYVVVNSGGWDTHKRNFETMRTKLPDLDRGMSALLEDLAQRGLLDQTIVWWSGEFGRTPRVQWEEPWNGGRGHYGRCFSAVVAGGGFEGGHAVGTSNPQGTDVRERPVTPRDLHASMYTLLGIDPDGPLPNPRGLDVPVLPAPDGPKGSGLLSEIMP